MSVSYYRIAWSLKLVLAARFPLSRPRRLRFSKTIRSLVAETKLDINDFVLPVFVVEKGDRAVEISSMPGIMSYPIESKDLIDYIQKALSIGIKAFLIFGVPSAKAVTESSIYSSNGVVQRVVKKLRRELGWEPIIFTDLCLCNYTVHGHCGIPVESRRGTVISNDETLKVYGKIAVSYAEAGTDFVAPSGMMDGQVKFIRESLDKEGYTDVGIMSYSVKYASGFYGPFREAVDSAPRFGDRRSYQMDPRNIWEALKEARMDLEEGADILMVKPALAYLDVIRLVKNSFPSTPLAAYNVSGEYSMVKIAASKGFIDEKTIVMEILYAIKRAGADIIITYHAIEAAQWLKEGFDPF